MSKIKHVITNKEESFGRKGLASIIFNIVNIMKRCYSRTTDVANMIKKTCYSRMTKYGRYKL